MLINYKHCFFGNTDVPYYPTVVKIILGLISCLRKWPKIACYRKKGFGNGLFLKQFQIKRVPFDLGGRRVLM